MPQPSRLLVFALLTFLSIGQALRPPWLFVLIFLMLVSLIFFS